MKCIYFLTPTVATTDQVSADLHEVGVNDFYLHVICRDHAGLKRHQIHSSNYFETLDVLRDGFIGAALGFLIGLAGIGLLLYVKPFGVHVVPTFVTPSWSERPRCLAPGKAASWESTASIRSSPSFTTTWSPASIWYWSMSASIEKR